MSETRGSGDLTAFITARLDEREAALRSAGDGRIAWLTYRLDNGELSHTTVAADHHDEYWCAGGRLLPEPASVLIVYDQAEALAEVAAKRAILARHFPVRSEGRLMCSNCLGSCTYWPCLDLRDLAAVWSDRAKWAVDAA